MPHNQRVFSWLNENARDLSQWLPASDGLEFNCETDRTDPRLALLSRTMIRSVAATGRAAWPAGALSAAASHR
jgi:hypothetical protein